MNLREFRVADGHARVGTVDIALSRPAAVNREGLDRVFHAHESIEPVDRV